MTGPKSLKDWLEESYSNMYITEGTVSASEITFDGRFVSPEPQPTPFEKELLEILIEECAEVIQRATKMMRFGINEVQPGQKLNNAERLSDEVGDLECMLLKCKDYGMIIGSRSHDAHRKKWAKLDKYMQNSPPPVLTEEEKRAGLKALFEPSNAFADLPFVESNTEMYKYVPVAPVPVMPRSTEKGVFPK